VHVMDQWTRPGPNGRRVKSDRHGRGKRWLARWTDPSGRERSRAFHLKDEAETFLGQMRTGENSGAWVDPRRSRVTFRTYRLRWLAMKQAGAESSYVWYKGIAEARVAERWDEAALSSITAAAYQEWLSEVRGQVSASRTRAHHVVVSGVLDLAVADRALTVNVTRSATLPTLPKKNPKALTPAQLAAYIAALENPTLSTKKHARRQKPAESCERAACFALVLAFSGLRFGECISLDVGQLVGRRLVVEDSIATVGGRQVEADTKSHRQREVAIPQPVADRVREMVGDRTTGPLLPAPRGGRWHHGVWTRVHRKACEDAGLGDVKVHQLRSTAASIAIRGGADAKVVQRMLGHHSAQLTLDSYSHLFEDRLDEVSDAMEAAVPPSGNRRLRAV
jgi:integrase